MLGTHLILFEYIDDTSIADKEMKKKNFIPFQ